MILVDFPAADATGDYHQQNQYGKNWEAGAADRAVGVQGSMLMGNDSGVRRRLLSGLQIIGYGFVFVDTDALGISANVGFVEDSAGQEIELFIFQSLKQAPADFSRGHNLIQRDAAQLTFASQTFAKGTQSLPP